MAKKTAKRVSWTAENVRTLKSLAKKKTPAPKSPSAKAHRGCAAPSAAARWPRPKRSTMSFKIGQTASAIWLPATDALVDARRLALLPIPPSSLSQLPLSDPQLRRREGAIPLTSGETSDLSMYGSALFAA